MRHKYLISSLPAPGGTNPYVSLFYKALEPTNIEVYAPPEINLEWVRSHVETVSAIHFHWPEYLWRSTPAIRSRRIFRTALRKYIPGAWRFFNLLDNLQARPKFKALEREITQCQALARFVFFLAFTKYFGIRIIWTMHNVEGHDHWRRIDRLGFRLLARRADLILCHSSLAKELGQKRYNPKCPMIVMQHGNYDGAYPPPRGREVVLRELGLDPRRPVAGCIGTIRDYKGFDLACEAVHALDGEVQLICAGMPFKGASLTRIRKLMGSIPGCVLRDAELSDQEFADLCGACDVILLPYRKITGSGALLAALTFGKGVIASDLPFFREILSGHEDAGVLVEPENVQALTDGIRRYLKTPLICRQTAARELADQYAWSRTIEPAAIAIRKMLSVQNERHSTEANT